jgi:hypothetical protein
MGADDAIDSLYAECERLREQLAAARSERDTAKALLAQYRLVGW